MNRQNRLSAPDGGFERRAIPAEVQLPGFGLHVLESHHAAGFVMPLGQWPFHKICWTPMGRGMLDAEGGSLPIRRDDVLLIPAQIEHRFVDHPSDPMTLVIVCFSPAIASEFTALGHLFERVRDRFPPCRPMCASNAFQLEEIRIGFRSLLREQSRRTIGYEGALHALLMALLVRLMRGCERGASPGLGDRERALDGVIDFIDTHFGEAIPVSSLAQRCGLSPRRFSEVFRRRTGKSPIEYLNLRRIAHAKERLRETGHIAYACHESGFQDMAYFYRVFRKHTGQTPGGFVKDAADSVGP